MLPEIYWGVSDSLSYPLHNSRHSQFVYLISTDEVKPSRLVILDIAKTLKVSVNMSITILDVGKYPTPSLHRIPA